MLGWQLHCHSGTKVQLSRQLIRKISHGGLLVPCAMVPQTWIFTGIFSGPLDILPFLITLRHYSLDDRINAGGEKGLGLLP